MTYWEQFQRLHVAFFTLEPSSSSPLNSPLLSPRVKHRTSNKLPSLGFQISSVNKSHHELKLFAIPLSHVKY